MHRNSRPRGQFFPHNSNRIFRIDRSVHAARFPIHPDSLHFYPIQRGPRRKFPEFQLTRARVSRNLSGGVVKQSRALARLSVEFLFRHAFFEREKKRKKGEEEEREEERKKKKDRCFTR